MLFIESYLLALKALIQGLSVSMLNVCIISCDIDSVSLPQATLSICRHSVFCCSYWSSVRPLVGVWYGLGLLLSIPYLVGLLNVNAIYFGAGSSKTSCIHLSLWLGSWKYIALSWKMVISSALIPTSHISYLFPPLLSSCNMTLPILLLLYHCY